MRYQVLIEKVHQTIDLNIYLFIKFRWITTTPVSINWYNYINLWQTDQWNKLMSTHITSYTPLNVAILFVVSEKKTTTGIL